MGKNNIATYFAQKQAESYNLFVPYIVAGDHGLDRLKEQILFLEQCGVAAIELGIPFSDPVADGPTIQKAGLRALQNGISLGKILDFLGTFKREVPIILMTYLNPIYVYGVDMFAKKCAEVGVAGVIIPDVPLEEEEIVANALENNDIAFIRLVALTSTEERMKEIGKRAEGFLYAVSVTGTTGARATHQERVYSYLEHLTSLTDVPVLAGFGVSTAKQARELSAYCDGVIVGSKIVELFHEGRDNEVQQLIEKSILKDNKNPIV